MGSRDFFLQALYFAVYVGLQVLFVRHIVLFDVAFCFIYIAFLLLLPFETDSVLLMLIALGIGLVVDSFYDTTGIHAAACVFAAYLRPWVIRLITPRGGYDQNLRISMQYMGGEWFFTYALILIFFHHAALFLIEASQWSLVPLALLKTVCSTAFTWLMVVVSQYLFYRKK